MPDLNKLDTNELEQELASRANVTKIETRLDWSDVVVAIDEEKPVFRRGKYTVLIIEHVGVA